MKADSAAETWPYSDVARGAVVPAGIAGKRQIRESVRATLPVRRASFLDGVSCCIDSDPPFRGNFPLIRRRTGYGGAQVKTLIPERCVPQHSSPQAGFGPQIS